MPRPTLWRQIHRVARQSFPSCPNLQEPRRGHGRVYLACARTEMGCAPMRPRRQQRLRELEREV